MDELLVEEVRCATGCWKWWSYYRRICEGFTHWTQAASSQRSVGNMKAFLSSLGSLCADPYGTVALGFHKVTLHRACSVPGCRLVKRLTHCWLCKQPNICKAGWICLKQSAVETSLNQVHLFHLCLIDKLGVIKTNFRFIQFIQIFFLVQMCTAL